MKALGVHQPSPLPENLALGRKFGYIFFFKFLPPLFLCNIPYHGMLVGGQGCAKMELMVGLPVGESPCPREDA